MTTRTIEIPHGRDIVETVSPGVLPEATSMVALALIDAAEVQGYRYTSIGYSAGPAGQVLVHCYAKR